MNHESDSRCLGRVKQNRARALFIGLLPPGDTCYTAAEVVKRALPGRDDRDSYLSHYKALDSLARVHGIGDGKNPGPDNIDPQTGKRPPGKKPGTLQPCRWNRKSWLAIVSDEMYDWLIDFNQKIVALARNQLSGTRYFCDLETFEIMAEAPVIPIQVAGVPPDATEDDERLSGQPLESQDEIERRDTSESSGPTEEPSPQKSQKRFVTCKLFLLPSFAVLFLILFFILFQEKKPSPMPTSSDPEIPQIKTAETRDQEIDKQSTLSLRLKHQKMDRQLQAYKHSVKSQFKDIPFVPNRSLERTNILVRSNRKREMADFNAVLIASHTSIRTPQNLEVHPP